MAVTVIASNLIGTGNQFSFTAAGSAMVVLTGVTVASSTSTAFSTGFTDVEVTVLGTMISSAQTRLLADSSFILGSGGSFQNYLASGSLSGLFLDGANSTAQIDGTFVAPEAIGLLLNGGGQVVTVTGSISAASGIYILAGGTQPDAVINSGQIIANANGDASFGLPFNNGILIENDGTRITNLASGVIMATSSEGNGIRANLGSNGVIVTNHGTIGALHAAALDFSSMITGSASILNTGLVQGSGVAFNGSGAGTFVMVNTGHMIGDVLLGTGDDSFDGRGGRITGQWFGGDGNDLYDGRGASLITGVVAGGIGSDTLLGGDGDETLDGGAGLDTVAGGGGDDALFGAGDLDLLRGGAGNDTLHGDDGDLVALGGDGDDIITADATTTAAIIEGRGGAGNDMFQGGLVRDNIFGGSGDDEVFSNSGDDLVFGDAGDDLLDGFEGLDSLHGGAGDDILFHAAGDAQLFGDQGRDVLTSGLGNNLLDGGTEDDSLSSGNGRDTLFGAAGDDTLNGGGDTDLMDGGFGADNLSGGLGKDTMDGGAGGDTLTGGASGDVLTGGTGADVFILLAATDTGTGAVTRDVITDFGNGPDILDLSLVDADTTQTGDQAFVYIGSNSYTNVAGQLRYLASTGLLSGDTNGDGLADFTIDLANLPSLSVADLIL